MKRKITITLILLFTSLLFFTNPSEAEHKKAIVEKFRLGNNLSNLFAQKFVDRVATRDNYLLFSTTRVTIGTKSRVIGFGVLGFVYIRDFDRSDK